MRLVIVTHVPHFRWGGRLYAYAPYAREIDVWADLFDEIAIAAPLVEGAPPGDTVAFERMNIALAPQEQVGGTTAGAKAAAFLGVPALAVRLARVLRTANAIHVRCPGNLGLLGVVLAPLFSDCLIAKYAGQWTSYPGEAWSTKLQRAILRSRWWRGPVTVYGKWPNEPAHIVPFFTSMLDEEQMKRARAASRRAGENGVLRVLYTGRLSGSKNLDVLLAALAELRGRAVPFHCTIVGDGPERGALEEMAVRLGLSEAVEFAGGVPFDRMPDFLERSGALVLVSNTEGWPKAIAEGMAFGLVCIGSDRGLIPHMLDEGRGVVVPARDVAALARALEHLAAHPAEYEPMRAQAAAWAQQYSRDGLRTALQQLLEQWWNMPFEGTREVSRSA